MEIKYSSLKNSISIREYIKYVLDNNIEAKDYRKINYIPALINIILILSAIFYIFYDSNIIKILILIILIMLLYIFVGYFISKIIGKKTIIKKFSDSNSEVYIKIENDIIISKNEYGSVKFPVRKIETIHLLRYGLILATEHNKIKVFIPKQELPLELSEFIDKFRKVNDKLIIVNKNESFKKKVLLIIINSIVVLAISIIIGVSLGKYSYNFKYHVKNLILSEDLIKTTEETRGGNIYQSENHNVEIYFPKGWKNKYGIEDTEECINVYYLTNGKKDDEAMLLFKFIESDKVKNSKEFNIYKYVTFDNDMFYEILTPKVVEIPKDDKEIKKEYTNMYNVFDVLSFKKFNKS